jgi:hypothetical protein
MSDYDIEEIETRKAYPDMSTSELSAEFDYLSDLYSDSSHLGLCQTRQSIYKHFAYVKALLDERYQIH